MPDVRLAGIRVATAEDGLLPVAQDLDLGSSPLGEVKYAAIFENGVSVRNIMSRLGASPKRTGMMPRPSNRSLTMASTASAASKSKMSASHPGT